MTYIVKKVQSSVLFIRKEKRKKRKITVINAINLSSQTLFLAFQEQLMN